MQPRRIIPLLLALALPVVPAAAEDGAEIGHVVAIDGRVTATFPGEPDRVLACGDPVHEGERLSSERGAHVVVARQGRHAHLGGESRMVLRRDPDGVGRVELLRGSVRLLDTADAPTARLAGAFGALSVPSPDVELRRLASGDLRICDWSAAGPSSCQQIDRSGRVRAVVEEAPGLDLGIRDLCAWTPRERIAWADFASPPPVSASPASASFEPELDPVEPGCGGDECTATPSIEPPADVVYTVEQPEFFNPVP
jgi:hypothetical protein